MGSVHETNPSLWVGTTDQGEFAPLDGNAYADVIVVGAGITGLTTARLLVEQGASVIVIDAGSICAGASGYTTAKITSLHGLTYSKIFDDFDDERARLYGEANEAGIAEVARLVAADGIDCGFERRAHTVYTTDEMAVDGIAREATVAADVGLPATYVTEADLPYDIAAGVRFTEQAQFHPRAYCLALADAVTSAGGRIHSHTRAHQIGDGTVETNMGDLRGTSIVVATHLPINQMGAYFARCEAQRSYAIAVTVDGDRPEDMYINVDTPTRSLRTAGEYLIVGGEGHKVGEAHDTTEHYRNLERWATEQFAVRSVDYRWSSQDWAAADGIPYIGRMAGHDDAVFVATAFHKWGMAQGTAAAMIMRDCVNGVDNPWLKVFDATRIAPKQSIDGIIGENMSVMKHMVGDRVTTDDAEDLETLSPGEGTVSHVNGEDIAAYRDESGVLHTSSAVCKHLGCLVNFNPAEKSWDCPCHGSRYSIDGAVIEGPTVDDLDERGIR